MSMYFFKKFTPETKVSLADRTQIQFTTLDGLIGYFATKSDDLANQFKGFIQQQRYGMSEISEEEFHRDYVEVKKNGKAVPDPKFWQRESLGSSGYERGTNPVAALDPAHVQARVAVAGRVGVVGTQTEEAPAGAPEAVKADPKAPPAVKLGPRKKPKSM